MKKIFLVEDNQDNADLIMDLLEGDFEITHFLSAQDILEALDSAPTNMPDLFLSDISLPGMDGEQLLREIRERSGFSEVPSIALTAHAMVSDKERFMNAGFNGYITKPIVDEEQLRQEIDKFIS